MLISILASIGVILGAIVLQTAALPALGATSIAPCLVICAVVALAFQTSPYVGMGTGLAVGLIMDSLFSLGIGNYALLLVIAGYVAGTAGIRFKPEALVVTAVLSVVAYMGFEFLSMLLMYFARSPINFGWGKLWRSIASMVLTGLCTIPVHLLLYRLMDRNKKHHDDFGMLFSD